MGPEHFVKLNVRRYLAEIGAYIFMPVQMGMGAATLDFLTCVPVVITPEMVGRTMGAFVSVETKAAGKLPTKRQQLIAGTMQQAGAVTVLAYGADDVQKALVEAGLR
jgi:ribosomal protein S19